MRNMLDGIIKLLQYVSVTATVLELILRLIRFFLSH